MKAMHYAAMAARKPTLLQRGLEKFLDAHLRIEHSLTPLFWAKELEKHVTRHHPRLRRRTTSGAAWVSPLRRLIRRNVEALHRALFPRTRALRHTEKNFEEERQAMKGLLPRPSLRLEGATRRWTTTWTTTATST